MKSRIALCLINVLFCWFSKLHETVWWNNEFSEVFQMKSGEPQGSINSLKFANYFMDKIPMALQNEHLRCFINGRFAGVLVYTDDLFLLSSSLVML